jgi:hypothetical protein
MSVSLRVLKSLVLNIQNNRLDATFLNSTRTVRDTFTILKNTTTTGFYTVTPCRLADTRNAVGGGPALAPNSTRSFPVTGGVCHIPSTAAAVSVNLTAVVPTAFGHLTLYPGNSVSVPLASSINFAPGVTRANNALVSLATDGTGTIKVKNGSAGFVHFVLDGTH